MADRLRQTDAVVLVVEDEAILRMNAAEVLEDSGYRVLEAADAETAIELIESHPGVRVLFTDVNLPGEFTGLELAREVHARWPYVRLLVTSGHAMLTDSQVPDDGHFIPKPYSPAKLTKAVREAICKR